VLFNSLSMGQRIDFFKEDVVFRLDGVYLLVEGYYWFANHANNPIIGDIYYPFPFWAGGPVDSVRIFNISVGRAIGFNMEDRFGASFLLHLTSMDTAWLQIKYRQKLNSDSAVYILKTTQGWGKPLESAEFKLVTPDSITIKKFSYPPDESCEMEKLRLYRWKSKIFMPNRDIIFHFYR